MRERTTHLETAIKAAIEAGKEIIKVYETADFDVDMKSDNSPLTTADIKANAKIVAHLNETDINILSEEGKHEDFNIRKDWSELWIVDPLDGTKEFIKRNGEFTVNIALIENGTPVLGVIYVPVKDKLYFGETTIGSYVVENAQSVIGEQLNAYMDKSKKMPSQALPETYTIVASRSHLSPETEAFFNSKKAEHKNVDTVSMGSSLKICLVAEGVAHVYPRYAPTMEWDTAAGHAIAIGAGKNLYDYETGKPMVYNREKLLNNWFLVK